jgi:Family of unknown function (DUF5677)
MAEENDKIVTQLNNEDEFIYEYVELLNRTIELIDNIIQLKYFSNELPKKITRDESVIGGNLTRLRKLSASFLQNICEKKLEICLILNRCIAETAINTKFLIIKGEDNVKKNYIKYSLITEKNLWEIILSNVKNRNDDILPIEERMQKSIQNSFNKSDFDLDEVRKSSKWKSIKERAYLVEGEMFYNVFYGNSSHSIHGNWQDLLSNNLKKIEDGFELNIKWNKPRPQIMDGVISLNIEIVKTFCEYELPNNDAMVSIINDCKILYDYHLFLVLKHEEFRKANY